MIYWVYIIQNSHDQSWYIGFTTDLQKRVTEHNQKKSPYTSRKFGKWKLIYAELYRDKKDALGREKFLKSGSGHKFIKKQITHYLQNSN